MTMFAINSQAYRKISTKADNICRAKKKKFSREKKKMRKH